MMESRLVFIHGLTPIHTGTGQSVDVIDLPVAREKVTNWPYIPGSSIKGVLRDAYSDVKDFPTTELFGPDSKTITDDNAAAGMLLFADAKLLCLPVRSFFGTFAWVTCHSALRRLNRDSKYASKKQPFPNRVSNINYEEAVICTQSDLCVNNTILLEDLNVKKLQDISADDCAESIAKLVFQDNTDQEIFKRRFVIISDDLFTALTETATEVVARIKIQDDTKTVQNGGLWYEEAIPSESIFWFPLRAAPRNKQDVFGPVKDSWIDLVQIGGNATVGRGIVRLVLEDV